MASKVPFRITNNQGLVLKGKLLNFEAGKPVIVFVHGFGGFMREPQYLYFKKYFLKLGYALCLFDFTNGLGASQRDIESVSYENYFADLLLVLRYLHQQGARQYYLIAHSLGGALSFDLLAGKGGEALPMPVEAIKAVTVINPFIKGVQTAEEFVGQRLFIKQEDGQAMVVLKRLLKRLKVKYSFFEHAEKFTVMPQAPKMKTPLLFILGQLDKTTPMVHSLEFTKELKCAYRVLRYADLGHTFFYRSALERLPEISQEIAAWFNQYK